MRDVVRHQVRAGLGSRDPPAASARRLKLTRMHPTRSGQDQIIGLRLVEEGCYLVETEHLEVGYWHPQPEIESGRIISRMLVPGTGLINFFPAS